MSRLGAQRTALFLYTVLVLLPAGVLGGLLWHQLAADHAKQLEAIPRDTENAVHRLVDGIRQRFDELMRQESAREFYQYNRDYWEKGTTLEEGRLVQTPIPSPLAVTERPRGVRAWFSWDYNYGADVAPVLLTGRPPGDAASTETYEREALGLMALEEFVLERLIKPSWRSSEAIADELEFEETAAPHAMPLGLVALNLNSHRDRDCIERDLAALDAAMGDLPLELQVRTGSFDVEALQDSAGRLRIVAQRLVEIPPLPRKVEPPPCFHGMVRSNVRAQGFEIDPDWLLQVLPCAAAEQVLSGRMRFHAPGAPPRDLGADAALASADLFDELEIDVSDPTLEDAARLWVSLDSTELRAAFRVQLAWLAGVAVVMVTSLVIGVRLLLGSVRASQEQARRTENFVAAVTHELRTPLAAVKMYGEMLRDGWARDEGKRQEYMARLVGEADRLDDLVDKVLQKRRLSGQPPTPEPGDLNLHVSALAPSLRLNAGRDDGDLEFELAPDLPPALLVPEAVREVLVNLVENARKYAAPAPGGEPLRVSTRRDARGRVLLEVADRGPGIPEEERARVFEAFYRIGDEQTRRTVGTGLGLHLVQLQARAMKARVQALPRPGGGTVFRVTFKTLRHPHA